MVATAAIVVAAEIAIGTAIGTIMVTVDGHHTGHRVHGDVADCYAASIFFLFFHDNAQKVISSLRTNSFTVSYRYRCDCDTSGTIICSIDFIDVIVILNPLVFLIICHRRWVGIS